MLASLTRHEWAAAVDGTVSRLLRRVGLMRPPVDALEVADALGIVVARDDRQSGRARIVRLTVANQGQTSILLRNDPRPERRQWAVAHEIGEAFASEVFDRLDLDPVDLPLDAREQIANLIAARLLLPSRWVRRVVARRGWNLAKLKRVFHTASHELLARRMLDFEPPVIVTIFDEGRVTFRRSNVLDRLPPLSTLERRCQERVYRTGKPTRDAESALFASGWPVHEPGWKREIVRVELGDWESSPW